MSREFNIFGPVYPDIHYHVDRVSVKSAIRDKIEKGRYFTLNAARQTGKTTLFREVIAELETEGDHFGVLLSFESLRCFDRAEFYEQLGAMITTDNLPSLKAMMPTQNLPTPEGLRHQRDFVNWLSHLGSVMNRRGLLIIDEFDAIGSELAEPLLGAFRHMYLNRHDISRHALQSIILVGVRNIPALLGGTQSPFNIADQYEVPYFTLEETTVLLAQHTTETGQVFAEDAVKFIYRESEGQPFLVNRLAQILTQEIVTNRAESILAAHVEKALINLLVENNTHFASIVSKATPHKTTLLPILFYDERRTNFRDSITQELLMYGILRREQEENFWIARVANPIYRKMLILTFTPSNGDVPVNGNIRHRYLIEGVLDMDGLLNGFKTMMEEHGVPLLRSNKTNRPLEIGGQYLLLSYLTAALDSIGGNVALETINSAGEMDLVVFFRGTRFIIETKIWYGKKRFIDGQQQLVNYVTAANLNKGYIVLFSEQDISAEVGAPDNRPIDTVLDGKQVQIYPIVIGK
ncbi:ATP-binding protein [Chloroflexi bacterium TSY]|nr:ATP-binding protein [Chloroflexi bacterium TSY]